MSQENVEIVRGMRTPVNVSRETRRREGDLARRARAAPLALCTRSRNTPGRGKDTGRTHDQQAWFGFAPAAIRERN
jgi:hypothetical protein